MQVIFCRQYEFLKERGEYKLFMSLRQMPKKFHIDVETKVQFSNKSIDDFKEMKLQFLTINNSGLT